MNFWSILFVIGLIIIGIGLWYYFTTYQTNPLGITLGGLIPALVGAYKLYIKWNDTPRLKFSGISHNIEPAYFITVEKKKGKGAVKNCEGKIIIEDIDTHTVWALGEPRQIDIVDKMPLRLFSLEKEKNIIDFPSADLVKGRSSNPKPLDKFLDNKLTVKVFSETHNPRPYTKTIREIIQLGDTN
jgi:hypothetical protein